MSGDHSHPSPPVFPQSAAETAEETGKSQSNTFCIVYYSTQYSECNDHKPQKTRQQGAWWRQKSALVVLVHVPRFQGLWIAAQTTTSLVFSQRQPPPETLVSPLVAEPHSYTHIDRESSCVTTRIHIAILVY